MFVFGWVIFAISIRCNLLNEIGATSFFISSYPKGNMSELALVLFRKAIFMKKIYRVSDRVLRTTSISIKISRKFPTQRRALQVVWCTLYTQFHDHLAIYCVLFNWLKCQLIARNGTWKEKHSLPFVAPLFLQCNKYKTGKCSVSLVPNSGISGHIEKGHHIRNRFHQGKNIK